MAENIDVNQINAALDDLASALRASSVRLSSDVDRTGQSLRQLSKTATFSEAAGAGLDHIAKTAPRTAMGLELAGNAAKSFYSATLGMTKALYDNERGAQVTARALTTLSTEITSTAKGIGAALMLIPGLGVAAKLLGAGLTALSFTAEGLTKTFEIAQEQNNNLFKSFNQLSQSGLGAVEGMDAVFNNLQSMKMSTAELDQFNQLLKGNSQELKLFGATAGEGAAIFAKNAGELFTRFNTELGMLGVTQEEQRRSTLNFMAQQARMGNTQKDLVTGTKKYIEELDRLATLTGASRQEQEEARNLILQQEELRAAMLIAQQEGDTKRAKELENFLKLSAALATSGDRRGAMGAAQFAAAGGIAGEESAAFERTYRGAIQAIQSGKTTEEALVAGANSARELLSDMAQTKRFGGDVSALLTGNFAQMLDFVQKMEKAGQSGNIKDLLESLQRERREAGGDTRANVELVASQQRTALELDKLLKEYIRLSPDFYKKIQEKFEDFVKSLRQIIDSLRNRTNPGQTTPPGQFSEVTPGGAVTGNPRLSQQAESARQRQGSQTPAAPGGAETTTPGGGSERTVRPQSSSARPSQGQEAHAPEGSSDSGIRLARVTSKSGQSASVDERYAPAFQSLVSYLDGVGYDIRSMGGYNPRSTINGQPSWHAKGAAIDINPATNPYGSTLITDMPPEISQIAKSFGLGWGGDWQSVKDAMHFSAGRNEGGTLAARNGGIASGPQSGFPATLHGREAIIPLASNSLLEKLATSPASEIQNAAGANQESQIVTLLSEKFDQMIEKISDGVYIQDQILRHSRA